MEKECGCGRMNQNRKHAYVYPKYVQVCLLRSSLCIFHCISQTSSLKPCYHLCHGLNYLNQQPLWTKHRGTSLHFISAAATSAGNHYLISQARPPELWRLQTYSFMPGSTGPRQCYWLHHDNCFSSCGPKQRSFTHTSSAPGFACFVSNWYSSHSYYCNLLEDKKKWGRCRRICHIRCPWYWWMDKAVV